jgi:ATP-dependent DNA helicase RecG
MRFGIKSGVSRVRNRALARVFHELQLMEVWGSGYKRCVEDCNLGNYPIPEWEELGAALRVTFSPHKATRLNIEESNDIAELSERQKTVLALFKPEKELSFRELFKILSGAIPERTFRHDLAFLKKKNLLQSKGKGRAVLWKSGHHIH